MKSAAPLRALGVTFIYIGAFLALVLLQFGRGGGFSFREGRLSVKAVLARGSTVPESVKISWPGILLELSSSSPALVVDGAGARRNLLPRSIARSGAGVKLLFQGGAELSVMPSGERAGQGFSLLARGPAGAFSSLSLAWRLSGLGRIEAKGGRSLLQSSGLTWDLGPSARLSGQGSGRLSLDAAGGAFSVVLVDAPKPEVAGKVPTRPPEDPASYRAVIAAWTDRLWAGLSGERWDEAGATWREAEAGGAFSETALAVWLAEGFGRGQATAALARAKVAAKLHPEALTWLTVPFLGDSIRKMQVLEAADLLERKRLATLLDAKDPSLFEKEGLVRFAIDRCPPEFARSILGFAASLETAGLDRGQLLGILACGVEAEGFLQAEENPFPALAAAAVDRLVTDIRETDAGLFLVTGEDGASELRESLRAGVALVAWGQAAGQPAKVGLGQGLVEAVLGLADARGFIPARGIPRAGSLEERSGSLAPERLYPLVAAGRWWPREVSFYREAGAGAWAWTCAPSLSLSRFSGGAVYTAGFPLGFEHYLSVYGVKPFLNIKLYGIDYRPDANFEIYNASGYYYRAAAGALHVKMKHKVETERVELAY